MFNALPPTSDLIILAIIAIVAGYVRGFSGFGAGLLFIPSASAILGPPLAVASFFLMDFFTTLHLIPNAVKKADWRTVTPLSIFSVIAVPLGTFTLLNIDPTFLRWSTSIIIFALLALLISGWRYQNQPKLIYSAGVGLFAGFLSGVAQVPGPPVVTYWMSGPSKSETIRANLITFFALLSLASGASFIVSGLFTQQAISVTLILAAPFAIAVILGARKFVQTDEQIFRKIAYGLIALSALSSLPILDSLLRG